MEHGKASNSNGIPNCFYYFILHCGLAPEKYHRIFTNFALIMDSSNFLKNQRNHTITKRLEIVLDPAN